MPGQRGRIHLTTALQGKKFSFKNAIKHHAGASRKIAASHRSKIATYRSVIKFESNLLALQGQMKADVNSTNPFWQKWIVPVQLSILRFQ